MSRAPLPHDEAERLAELASYGILDTLPEQSYDDIALLAANICSTPIAVVSLIDQDRQWFKSEVGLGETETSRDVAFCAHAILEPDRLLVVPDATSDERFSDNPLVTDDPSIRFYAGAPLVTGTGRALGTLCVIDRVERTLEPHQLRSLEALSRQVVAQLNLSRALDELKDKQAALEKALREKASIVATVSHELRTPLTAVRGYVDVLRDTDSGLSREDQAELLTATALQAAELSTILDDLLASARADAGTLAVQRVPVTLGAQVHQVIEGLEATERVSIDGDRSGSSALGDPARIRQIVRNLITNAFRYGADPVRVTVVDDGAWSHVLVSDAGDGIAPDDHERVFEQFEIGHGSASNANSIGLGLFIARRLAELMGGSLTYRREHGRSVFDLCLPVSV